MFVDGNHTRRSHRQFVVVTDRQHPHCTFAHTVTLLCDTLPVTTPQHTVSPTDTDKADPAVKLVSGITLLMGTIVVPTHRRFVVVPDRTIQLLCDTLPDTTPYTPTKTDKADQGIVLLMGTIPVDLTASLWW